jgi:hypothetical protein
MSNVKHYVHRFCAMTTMLAFLALVALAPSQEPIDVEMVSPVAYQPVSAYPSSQTTTATHTVKHKRIDLYRHLKAGHLAVALNNGASFDLAPCKYEDGSGQRVGCYWNAQQRVNNVGNTFVVIYGHVYYL